MIVGPTSGTRTEPMDCYKFIRGTTATFKFTPQSGLSSTSLDVGTFPTAYILQPVFLATAGGSNPMVLAEIQGTLVAGQLFEYEFTWDVPAGLVALDDYVVQYQGQIASNMFQFGSEYFSVLAFPEQISMKLAPYATVSDLRLAKFNIDSFLPNELAKDLLLRDHALQFHLNNAATKLREELALFQLRSNKENYKLFCIYYAIYTILLASRGEDGSSVSDQNLSTWRSMWKDILAQEKRQGANSQGISFGRG